jgi:hypothetical protein
MEAETAVLRRLVRGVSPALASPMHDRGGTQRDCEPGAGGDCTDRRVRPSERVSRLRPAPLIAPPHDARPVDRVPELARHHQLDELGMPTRAASPIPPAARARACGSGSARRPKPAPAACPRGSPSPSLRLERVGGHGRRRARSARARRSAAANPARGCCRHRGCRHRAHHNRRHVALPHRAARCLGLERMGDPDRIQDQRIVGATQAKRTSWRNSVPTNSSPAHRCPGPGYGSARPSERSPADQGSAPATPGHNNRRPPAA